MYKEMQYRAQIANSAPKAYREIQGKEKKGDGLMYMSKKWKRNDRQQQKKKKEKKRKERKRKRKAGIRKKTTTQLYLSHLHLNQNSESYLEK